MGFCDFEITETVISFELAVGESWFPHMSTEERGN